MNENVPEQMMEAARGYEDLFVPALFEPWTKHVLDAVDVPDGSRVLDVACGTGVLTRAALGRTGPNGQVFGVDAAPGMIAVACDLESRIDWELGTAESLAFQDGMFDRVVSQFGMMFFQDRQLSSDEMFRVLKPSGAVAVAVWDAVDKNPAYLDLIGLLDSKIGTEAGDASRLPFNLGDTNHVAAALRKSGFVDVSVETKVESARFPSARTVVEAELRGWLPLFDIFLSEDEIEDILADSDRTLSTYLQGNSVVFPMSAHIFSARKPG